MEEAGEKNQKTGRKIIHQKTDKREKMSKEQGKREIKQNLNLTEKDKYTMMSAIWKGEDYE